VGWWQRLLHAAAAARNAAELAIGLLLDVQWHRGPP